MVAAVGRWTGQTQEERRAERRELLLVSATRLYGSLGFRNTGVRAICRDAGLTERYFYESFANGEELLLAAFGRVVVAMRDTIAAVDDATVRSDDRVRRMLHAYYAALQGNPAEARVFLIEIVGVAEAIDRAFEESLIVLTGPMVDVYDPERKGPLSTNPLMRRGVAGGLLHIALAWGAADYAQPIDQVVDAALTLCRLAVPSGCG